MLTRLLVLAAAAVGTVPPALSAAPDSVVAAGVSNFRVLTPIESVADGSSYRELPEIPVWPENPDSGLGMSTGGDHERFGGFPCVPPQGQPWVENLLQKAMQWFSEPDCVQIVTPDLHLLRNSELGSRQFRIYEHEAASAYLESFLKFNSRAFRLGYKRSGRYLPMIRRIFSEEGLPEALIYLPAVESNFNPYARSPARAMGLWQFMAATARRFDLRVRYPWYDERRDPEKATRAAAHLLVYLHDRYGNWELALAAYNAGEGRVNRAIREAHSRGLDPQYWNLRLPPQTRAYVPAFLAMVKLYRDPVEHGFYLVETEQPLETEAIQLGKASSLAEVAHRLKIPLPQLVRLNPAWRRGYIPVKSGKSVMLRLPKGRTNDLLASLETETFSSLPWLTHTVERRETLSKIARGYGIAMADIVSVNPIPDRHFLSIGQKLIIPLEPDAGRPNTGVNDPPENKSEEATMPANAKLHLHKVNVGDTLSSISRRYRVSEEDLRRWNMKLEDPLRPSQPMFVFLPVREQEMSLAMKVPSS